MRTVTIRECEGGPDVVLLDLAAYLAILTTCESPAFVRVLGSVFQDAAREPAALIICILGLAVVLVLVRPYHVARAIVGAVSLGMFLLMLPFSSTVAAAVLALLLLYVGLRFIFRGSDWASTFIPEAVAAGTCLKALLSSSDLQRLVAGGGGIGTLLIVLVLIPFRGRLVQRVQRVIMAAVSIYVSLHQLLTRPFSVQTSAMALLAVAAVGAFWLARRPRRG